MLKLLVFGLGYLAAGFMVDLMYPRVARVPCFADTLLWFAAVHAAGLVGGFIAVSLLNRTRRYDSAHADYDDRPPTDPA